MAVSFCLSALEWALARACLEIFNSAQSSQFTSQVFTDRLLAAGTRIRKDGRGRALDNVFIERPLRSVKYEEVYIRDYRSPADAFARLSR